MPEFHRNAQEMTKCLEILRKSARKIRNMLEISGICEKFYFSFHFFIRLPKAQTADLTAELALAQAELEVRLHRGAAG